MSIRWMDTALRDRLLAEHEAAKDEAVQSDARRRAENQLLAADRRSGFGRRHGDSNR